LHARSALGVREVAREAIARELEPLDERGRDLGRRVAQVGAGAPRTLALRLLPAAGAGAPPRIEPDGHGAEPEERDRRLAVMDQRRLGLAREPRRPPPAPSAPPPHTCAPALITAPARPAPVPGPRHRGAGGRAAPARLADERRPAGGAGDPGTQRHARTLAHPAAAKKPGAAGPGPDRSTRPKP